VKAVVQRVARASVRIDGQPRAEIGPGFLVLLGVHKEDTSDDVAWMARKIAGLRVFADQDGQMNQSLAQVGGQILVVSQFTLIASTRNGNRPSFNDAAPPDIGERLYLDTVSHLRTLLGQPVQTGVFAACMEVSLVNDGPVTITLDTRHRE